MRSVGDVVAVDELGIADGAPWVSISLVGRTTDIEALARSGRMTYG